MLFVPSLISYKTILVSDEKPDALECAAYKTPPPYSRISRKT